MIIPYEENKKFSVALAMSLNPELTQEEAEKKYDDRFGGGDIKFFQKHGYYPLDSGSFYIENAHRLDELEQMPEEELDKEIVAFLKAEKERINQLHEENNNNTKASFWRRLFGH